MSVESSASVSLEERVRRKITWYRVPLMAVAAVAVLGFVYNPQAFFYGAPIALLGELMQVWAASHLHKDRHLTISGPYSYVRNPMYIGRFLLGLGFFTMTWNLYLVAGYVVVFAAYAHMRVGREEARLREIFRPAYQDYCSKVRRWLPGLKAYSGSEARRASWRQVCANHEHLNLIGLIVMLALVYVRIERFAHWHWTL